MGSMPRSIRDRAKRFAAVRTLLVGENRLENRFGFGFSRIHSISKLCTTRWSTRQGLEQACVLARCDRRCFGNAWLRAERLRARLT
jgi:hypothetical protein